MKTRSRLVVVGLALGLGTAGVAWAEGWGSFEAAFPSQPCHDGWMGCNVDGVHIDPELVEDTTGVPTPSDLRVGWFDLQATSSFSPFVGLSAYEGGPAVAAVDEGDEVEGGDEIDDGDALEGGDGAAMVEAREAASAADEAANQAAVEAAARRAASADAAREARAAEQARRQAEEDARERRREEQAMQKQAEAAAAAAASAAMASQAAEQDRLSREAEAARQKAAQAESARQAADQAAAAAAAEEKLRQQQAAEEDRLQQEAEAARVAAEDEARRTAEEERRQQEEEAARVAAAAAAAAAEADRQAAAEKLAADQMAAEQAAAAEQASAAEQAAAAALAAEDPTTQDGDATAEGDLPKPPPAGGDDSCGDVVALEPSAMLGKLSEGQLGCLEGSLSTAAKMTDKEKISRILMVNAYSKGDKKTWESLVRRHLDEIDQSDPDLCYKYALHLSRMGPGRASGVIRWANVALENRTVWTGDTYSSRVFSLYKLRAAASQSLWRKAEEDHAAAPSDETGAKVDKYRAMTKVNAREWYEYAKDVGKDTTTALQLCMSAAGTADYCEAS